MLSADKLVVDTRFLANYCIDGTWGLRQDQVDSSGGSYKIVWITNKEGGFDGFHDYFYKIYIVPF
jgi:hypothetical protein